MARNKGFLIFFVGFLDVNVCQFSLPLQKGFKGQMAHFGDFVVQISAPKSSKAWLWLKGSFIFNGNKSNNYGKCIKNNIRLFNKIK